MTARIRYQLVDVFTDTPLSGNPLAVFLNGRGLSTAKMQAIAREMNLSETVFLFPAEEGGHAKVRIFTPRTELPFAGHPILGTAWVLAQPMEMPELVLETGMGKVTVRMERQDGVLFEAHMRQPTPTFDGDLPDDEILRALGLESERAGLLGPIRARNGPMHYLVEVRARAELDAIDIGSLDLSRLTPHNGILAFAQEGKEIHARYFAPGAGIPEDPATGSANGPLGYLLFQKGRLDGDTTLVVHQGTVMQRPSRLLVRIKPMADSTEPEVWVGGQAVVIARGEMNV